MAEILRDLDDAHQHYAAIRDGYERMMEGLLPFQIQSGEGAGLWYQVIDYDGGDNWPETSCSAMFAYATILWLRSILAVATRASASSAAGILSSQRRSTGWGWTR